MSQVASITVHVADYPQVKAVLDAARNVCEVNTDLRWKVDEAIERLGVSLEALA